MSTAEIVYPVLESLNSEDAFDFFKRSPKVFTEILFGKAIPSQYNDFIRYVFEHPETWNKFLFLLDRVIIPEKLRDQWLLQTFLFLKNDPEFKRRYGNEKYAVYYDSSGFDYTDEELAERSNTDYPTSQELQDITTSDWLLRPKFLRRLFEKLGILDRLPEFKKLTDKEILDFFQKNYTYTVRVKYEDAWTRDSETAMKHLPILDLELLPEDIQEIESMEEQRKSPYELMRMKKTQLGREILQDYFPWYFREVLHPVGSPRRIQRARSVSPGKKKRSSRSPSPRRTRRLSL